MARMNKDYQDALQKCLGKIVKSLVSILDVLLIKMNTYFLDHQQKVIKTQANSVRKVTEFVKILRTMEDNAFFAFLTALGQLNCRHVANEIRLAAKLPLPPPPHLAPHSNDTDEQALKERVMKYVKPEMLHLMTLMPLLRNCDLLTVADEDDLMNRQVPPAERANKFVYHILPSKGPRGYRLFIKCLQEEKEHHGHQELVRLLTTPQGEDTSHRNLSTLPPQYEITGAAVAIAFEHAVKQGVREANHFKIVMLGPEGAGKTSTVLSLLGEDFQSGQPSTVGADIHKVNSFTVDRICVYNWRTTKEFQLHLEEISTHYIHEMKEEMTQGLSSRSLPTEGHKEYNRVSESAGLEVLQSKVHMPDSNIKVVIYDLGGQEIYYEVHYLFLASHDVVFLTFNASVDLDEPVVRRHRYTMLRVRKDTKKAQTTFEVIEATLHTIYSRCGRVAIKGSLSYRNPTVIMVATHSVNLTYIEKEKITNTLLGRLPGKLQDHFPKRRSDLIHFIDNNKRDTKSFDCLRAVAVNAAGGTLTEERPIAYLKFEEKVLTLSQEESEITKEKAFRIATEAGLEPSNDALLALLEYYTLKGILLYYPDVEVLKNTIFISPQRVSNLVTCVIKTHDYGEIRPRADLRDKYERFDDFGVLEEEVLDDMLEKRNMLENVESVSSKAYSKDIVLGLLKRFDLVTEIDRNTKFENEDRTYLTPDSGGVFFVPSMLVCNTTDVYKTLEGHTNNTILYYFPDKFLPDIVFNHMLIRTTKWCVAEGHRIRCVSNGIGVFDFSNNTQSFALQCCSDSHCIKCHISVRKQAVHGRDLWQQRQDLFIRTKKIIDDVHKYYIGKTKNPVVCIDCPYHHDEECAPHILFDTIKSNAHCTMVNRPISKDTYKLLLEPTDQCGAARPPCVAGAVVIDQITDKESTPTMKDLNRYVTNIYAADWESIGMELELKYETLYIISRDHQHDSITCFKRTLDKWLTSNPHGTWRTLEVAITNVNRSRLGLKPVDDIYC